MSKQIDTSDIPEAGPEWFAKAKAKAPEGETLSEAYTRIVTEQQIAYDELIAKLRSYAASANSPEVMVPVWLLTQAADMLRDMDP